MKSRERSCGGAPRRWRLGRRHASSADAAARDAVDAASPPGGRCAKMSRPFAPGTAGLPALQRCGLGGDRAPFYAIDATPHKFRQQPELRRAAPRPASLTRPLRLRVHPPASARGQTTRALPWEEAKARLLRLGIKGAQQPARARELFPSPARARRAWTSSNDHGFFCYSVQMWRIRKKAALRPTDPLSQASV